MNVGGSRAELSVQTKDAKKLVTKELRLDRWTKINQSYVLHLQGTYKRTQHNDHG